MTCHDIKDHKYYFDYKKRELIDHWLLKPTDKVYISIVRSAIGIHCNYNDDSSVEVGILHDDFSLHHPYGKWKTYFKNDNIEPYFNLNDLDKLIGEVKEYL